MENGNETREMLNKYDNVHFVKHIVSIPAKPYLNNEIKLYATIYKLLNVNIIVLHLIPSLS